MLRNISNKNKKHIFYFLYFVYVRDGDAEFVDHEDNGSGFN